MFFTSEEHKDFYINNMELISYKDAYHKSLIYLIGATDTTRLHSRDIYDVLNDQIQLDCFSRGWQTSGTTRICRLAFNLFNGFIDEVDAPLYTPYHLLGYDLDDVFIQAIMIRFHVTI